MIFVRLNPFVPIDLIGLGPSYDFGSTRLIDKVHFDLVRLYLRRRTTARSRQWRIKCNCVVLKNYRQLIVEFHTLHNWFFKFRQKKLDPSVQTRVNTLLDNEFRWYDFLVTYPERTFVFRVVVRCTNVFDSMWISRISPPPRLLRGRTASRRSRHARAIELSACTHQDNDVTYVIKHNLQVEISKRNDCRRIPYVHV